MKRLGKLFAMVAVLLVLQGRSFGYGNDGHQIIGAIADERLKNSPQLQKLRRFLQTNESLMAVATWADRARDTDFDDESRFFRQHDPAQASHHFVNIPFKLNHYSESTFIGTGDNDVVQAIGRCINVLAGNDTPQTNPTQLSPHMAIMLLTHYVGDLHQPLHVGIGYIATVNHHEKFIVPGPHAAAFQGDRGANFLHFGSQKLHGYWDTTAVHLAMQKAHFPTSHLTPQDVRAYAKHLVDTVPPQTSWDAGGDKSTWASQWADDVLPLSKKAYAGIRLDDQFFMVPDHENQPNGPKHKEWNITFVDRAAYDATARDAVEVQLAKAGYRLSKLLEAIGQLLP